VNVTLVGGPEDGAIIEIPAGYAAIYVTGSATSLQSSPGASMYLKSHKTDERFYFAKESEQWP
jgi:hypothetical protein